MTEPVVQARKQGRAGRLTLNRPKALHSLNSEMVRMMTEALLAWQDDPEVELIVVDYADGTRGFCAGGDVRMLAESGAADCTEACAFFADECRLNVLIQEYAKPYAAIIDGVTMGGGVGISVHGRYRIATPNTVFAMPGYGIGLFPDVGGDWFQLRLSGQMSIWLALAGESLKGRDVVAAGIGTHYAQDVSGLANDRCLNGIDVRHGVEEVAAPSLADRLDETDACFVALSAEQIIASHQADSDWSGQQADLLLSKSPLTLKIAHRQLREGASLIDVYDNMQMQYRIACRLVSTANFREGVRAALIDRDNTQVWQPMSLAAVTPDLVGTFFAPLGNNELRFIGEQI